MIGLAMKIFVSAWVHEVAVPCVRSNIEVKSCPHDPSQFLVSLWGGGKVLMWGLPGEVAGALADGRTGVDATLTVLHK